MLRWIWWGGNSWSEPCEKWMARACKSKIRDPFAGLQFMYGMACKGEKALPYWGHTGWKVATRYMHDIELSRKNKMVIFRFTGDGRLKCVCLLDSHFLFKIHSSSDYVLFPLHPSLAMIGHLAVSVFLYNSSALSSSSLQPERWGKHVLCWWSMCKNMYHNPEDHNLNKWVAS